MTTVGGTFFDGVGSRGHEGSLSLRGVSVLMLSGDLQLEIPLERLRVEARLGNTPRRITWGDEKSFVSLDHERVDELAAALPRRVGLSWVAWLEARMGVAIAALVLVIGVGYGFAVWGVPALAEVAAFAVPEEVSDQLGATTLSNIEELLGASGLAQERQDELRDYLAAFGAVKRLEFRSSKLLGANAFALSATTVTLTDQLIELADDDEELLAVYLHELGHARLRHVERSILQSSAWLVMLTVITGDLAGVGELILTLPIVIGQTAYSREFERAADAFAVDELIRAGVSPRRLATILQKLEASHLARAASAEEAEAMELNRREGESAGHAEDRGIAVETDEPSRATRILFDYLSTHPATAQRIAYIESRAD